MIKNNLNERLEQAFERLQSNIENALIISHLQSDDKEVNIYLIAKQPDKKLYFGILEMPYIDKKQIAGIPLSNIEVLEVNEVPLIPFWSKPYIESNIKKNESMNIKQLFYSDKDFQEKIIFIHYAKSQNYIASKADDLLFALGFSAGMDSVPICVATTQSVKDYSINESGDITFSFESGFLGLERYINIIEIFPLLSKHCYKALNNTDLIEKMFNSKNGQLLAFRKNLIEKSSPEKLNELVEVLNKPESNPEISNLENETLNKDILVLNQEAYEKIFKNLITEEVLAPYKRNK